jgi:ribosomal protein S18 acetylase RimI-like enzyme
VAAYAQARHFIDDAAVDRAHRGYGLAQLVKAHMLNKIRRELPEVAQVRTNVDASNEPRLAVNRRSGFKPVHTMISVTAQA